MNLISADLLHISMEHELLQQYLDELGFTCYPRELRLEGERHPLVDLAAYKGDNFWAFEYKSFADWIGRGIEQCQCYARWFDRVSLVIERRLTTRSKFYHICENLGYGILLRGIEGSWAWKLDPELQHPSDRNRSFVMSMFAAEPRFLHYLGDYRVPLEKSSKVQSDYRAMVEIEASLADQWASQLSKQSRNLYVAITNTGTLLEPQKEKLIVYSKAPLGLDHHITTDEVRRWLRDPRIVYVINVPGFDDDFNKLERYLRSRNCRVVELLNLPDRISFMVSNIVRYLGQCERETYTKERVVKEVLETVRGKYASTE
jgi:hypothetical protein